METVRDRFERAVDAVVDGDRGPLESFLRDDPVLAFARSAREHRATLLHYCAANGVEQERQKTPANVVEIVGLLLAAGADANATANIYGGTTALTLAATSIHPEKAGVQDALLDALIEGGAVLHDGDVLACLMNGRFAAACFLAKRGAKLGAAELAGLGRLEELQQVSESDGTMEQRNLGFLLASEYGHTAVIEYLAEQGVDCFTARSDGQTGLHMAAIGAQANTAELLLRLGLSIDARNQYGATPHGQARWSAEKSGQPERYAAVIAVLERAGAN